MDTVKIGEFLTSLRKSKGLTQQEVAQALYVTQKTVSRWENGNGIPDINILVDVAQFYDISVDELLKGERNLKDQSKVTVNEKNLNRSKLIENHLMKKQNLIFIISTSILVILFILGLIFWLLSYNEIGLVINFSGLIIGIFGYIYGTLELRRILNDEDNIELQEDLLKTKLQLKKKNLLFTDITFIIFIIFIILLFNSISFKNVYSYYNNYNFFLNLEFIILILFIIFIYILIRKVLIVNEFDITKLNKKLLLIMLAASILSSFILFATYYSYSEISIGSSISTYITTYKYYFNSFYFVNFIPSLYIFRTLSIILYILVIFIGIKGYKKSSIKLLFINLILGVIANGIIILDYYLFCENSNIHYTTTITFVGLLLFLISFIIGIYQIIYKKKHNNQTIS